MRRKRRYSPFQLLIALIIPANFHQLKAKITWKKLETTLNRQKNHFIDLAKS
jgi:hypothetical protein